MKRKLLLISVILFISSVVNAQFLHFGVRAFMSPSLSMEYFVHNNTEYVYYFANNQNETIRFSGFETSNIKSKTPFPDIYVRYNLGTHWFFQADTYVMWFTNEAKYKNSVDFPDYANQFNPLSTDPNWGYNSLQMKWSFSGTAITAGYTFMKTKTLRPYIYAGGALLNLLNLKQGDHYQERNFRNTIIFKNLSTFEKRTSYFRVGLGLQYYGFSLDVYLQNSTQKSLDINYDPEDTNEVKLVNLETTPVANYKAFRSVNVSIGLNILSYNVSKKHE